ncbi:acylphosphatase-2 [Tetranychus urticae]|uniref:acylphosphatase n=1 Tax=Tetranychus urticae TaxID=32264 RepID=T1KG04_TETUR|nr:acylphosphatase-2 [Tetranychus urticae]
MYTSTAISSASTYHVSSISSSSPINRVLVQIDFEVFGDFSGVYFTKYAKEMSEKLGLKGWVMLSRRGTVIGQIQGEKEKIDEMALWLRLQGSPGSRIEHANFTNWQIIDSITYRNFSIRF